MMVVDTTTSMTLTKFKQPLSRGLRINRYIKFEIGSVVNDAIRNRIFSVDFILLESIDSFKEMLLGSR